MAFALGGHPAFLVNHPDYVEDVLVVNHSGYSKPPAVRRPRSLLGSGLLTAEGELHRERRHVAGGAFAPTRLQGYASIVIGAADRLESRWHDGEVVDIAAEMRRLTLDVIGSILFDIDLAPQAAATGRALETVAASIDPLFSLVAPVRRVEPAAACLRGLVDRLIDQRVAAGEGGDDMVSVLRRAEGSTGMPVSGQLRDDVFTLFVAGHDTIANALVWTWHLLHQHPDAAARLRGELEDRLGGRAPAWHDVAALPYTGWVLAEALRLYPPAWVLTRRALVDHDLGDVTVPSGAIVVMSQYLLHRDARFYSDPLTFTPERWDVSAPGTRPRLAYFPFGAGPRACIGQGLALLEGVLTVAAIAGRWRCQVLAPVVGDARATLRPRGPVPARLSRLDGARRTD